MYCCYQHGSNFQKILNNLTNHCTAKKCHVCSIHGTLKALLQNTSQTDILGFINHTFQVLLTILFLNHTLNVDLDTFPLQRQHSIVKWVIEILLFLASCVHNAICCQRLVKGSVASKMPWDPSNAKPVLSLCFTVLSYCGCLLNSSEHRPVVNATLSEVQTNWASRVKPYQAWLVT